MSGNEIAVVQSSTAALDQLEHGEREIAISELLVRSRDYLAVAMQQANAPRALADFKADITAVAEYAKQKRLSQGIQLDATAMVRRSERALGVAIREGQDRGEIRQRGGNQGTHVPGVRGSVSRTEGAAVSDIASPCDYAKHTELYGDGKEGGNGMYAMADATDEQFEEALTEAREEGNVSRANVVRKIRGGAAPDTDGEPKGRTFTANSTHAQILDLARTGMGNAAIAKQVGVSANTVSEVVIQNPDVRAEREKLNVLARTVDALMGATYALESIGEFSAVDPAQGQEWLDKLQRHIKAVSTVRNSIRKAMES